MPENVTDLMQLATTDPKEAAENINRAKLFDMPPHEYKKLKPEINQEAQAIENSVEATPAVAEYMKQSPEHTSLVKNDVESLNYLERQAKYFNRYVNEIPGNQREIVDIRLKQMDDPESVTEHDRLLLDSLIAEQADLGDETFGIDGTYEQLPAHIAGAVAEMWRGIEDNKELVTGLTAAGATIGAAATVAVPPFS